MIRPLAAAAALVTLALAGVASAQTYGQPIYLNAYGRPIGGSPLVRGRDPVLCRDGALG